ncbi:hypothetical protein [Streptomyces sp. NPDC048172]|uniref:hypothetical protein n=1 Tax=Streptomyces sp. NPDC048172 TaxID=3365505 RepID=UPI0037144F6D
MRTYLMACAVLGALLVTGLLSPFTDAEAETTTTTARPACRAEIDGSTGRVACRNETGRTARVQLHIECRRWWDIDVDGEPVTLAPGKSVRLADRCWAEVRKAWVSFPR